MSSRSCGTPGCGASRSSTASADPRCSRYLRLTTAGAGAATLQVKNLDTPSPPPPEWHSPWPEQPLGQTRSEQSALENLGVCGDNGSGMMAGLGKEKHARCVRRGIAGSRRAHPG
eukprot:scaffold43864_cov59-Phaeocystis_antarctica.AAC.8